MRFVGLACSLQLPSTTSRGAAVPGSPRGSARIRRWSECCRPSFGTTNSSSASCLQRHFPFEVRRCSSAKRLRLSRNSFLTNQTMQISQSEIIMRVRHFVHENFLYMHSNFQLRDDDLLLEKGVIDSMTIVEISSFTEREFGINAIEDEVNHANFGSLAGIGRFVSERQSVRAA